MTLAQQFDAYRAWRDDVGRLNERLRAWLAESDLLDNESEQDRKSVV